MSESGNFLKISTIYLPLITIEPVSITSVIFSLGMKVLIEISESLADKYKPSFSKSNFIPVNIGIRFLLDIAFEVFNKFSSKIFFLITNFIFFPSF